MSGKEHRKVVTDQGVGSPDPAEVELLARGSPRSSSSDRDAVRLGNQGTLQEIATGTVKKRGKDEGKPTGTTLVHSRLNFMVGNIQRSNSLSHAEKKRKYMDTSAENLNPEDGVYIKKECPEVFVLKEELNQIVRLVKELEKKTGEMYNPKKELVNLVSKLSRSVQVLNRTSILTWLENHRYEPVEKMTIDADVQTDAESSGDEVQTKTPKATMVDCATQIENWSQRRPELTTWTQVTNFKEFQEISKKEWPSNIYSSTEIKIGNPLATKDSAVKVVFVEPEDTQMTRSIQSLYKDRYPELLEIEEDYGILEQVTKIGNMESRRKVIKILATNPEDLWEKLNRLKENTENGEWIVMHHLTWMDNKQLQKVVEAVFHETETKVVIYTNRTKVESEVEKKTKKLKEFKTYAITVQGEGKEFKDIIKEVSGCLQTEPSAKQIKSIRSTREGKVLIVLEKDDDAKENIKTKIQNISNSIIVKDASNKKNSKNQTIHIRGLCEGTNKIDIETAIKEAIEPNEETYIKIGDPRPNRDRTLAVTATVDQRTSDKIIESRYLRVGLVKCSVEKRIDLKRCFKCWAFDHEAAQCDGTDRKDLCFKCGQKGHASKTCENEEYCPICAVQGHKTGGGRCKAFKKALSLARRGERQQLF